MRVSKHVRAIGIAVLALLLIAAAFMVFSIFIGCTANDLITPANAKARAYHNDLLDYEWPQFQGDPSFTRFSAGPAPEAPEILWKGNITGIRSYISAFNGKVFVTTSTTVFALDRETGSIIWNAMVPAPGPWSAVYKLDDTHMVVGSSCLNPDTGRILWTSANFSATPEPLFSYNVYSPEERMFYV